MSPQTTDVEMDNGEIISDVPVGTRKGELLERLKKRDQKNLGVDKPTDTPAVSKFDASPAGKMTAWAGGALDVGRSIASTVATDAVGGLAGAGQVAENALGLSHEDPVAVIRAWQKHAYPVETEEGKKIAGALSVPGELLHKGAEKIGGTPQQMGDWTWNATGSPLLATAAELMPDVAQMITGAKAPAMMKDFAAKGAAEIARDAIRNSTKTEAMRTARQSHLKVSPAEYGGGVGQKITSMSNKAEIAREISAENNGRVVDMFKVNMGLPDDAKVDRYTFASVRAKEAMPYQEGRSLPRMSMDAEYLRDGYAAGSKFDQLTADFEEKDLQDLEEKIAKLRGTYMQPSWSANSAVNAMSYLRESSSDVLLSRNSTSVDRKFAQAQREMAQAIEDRLWRHASESGQPEMAARFQAARKRLAQLHVWEEAVDMDKGYFSSRSLVAQRKAMGATRVDPFTDELKIVADAAGAFPESFQDLKPTMPVSVFERYMMIGGAGYAIGGWLTGSAEGGAITSGTSVAISASGIAGRGAMTSDWWQKSMMKPQSGKSGPIRRGVMQAGEKAEAVGAIAGAEGGNNE